MTNKEYTYDIDKYTIGVDENGEDGIGLTIAIIKNGKINFLGNCYGENARCIDLLIKENAELKSQLRGTTHCFDEEEHNKLKEEITDLSKEIDMWNSKYNDMFDENRMLKKQLEEKENIACNWKDSCLENAGKIEISENQQKEFIKWIENYLELLDYDNIDEQIGYDMIEEILQKYKSIIGDEK